MSAVTAQAIDDAVARVHLIALNKLAARLEEEVDPIRIERLLAIALRAKRPDGQRPRQPTPPAQASEDGQGFAKPGERAVSNTAQTVVTAVPLCPPLPAGSCRGFAPSEGNFGGSADAQLAGSSVPATTPTPRQSRTNLPRQASTNDEHELTLDNLPAGPVDPLALAQPMTDDEFHALFKEVGLTEAHRRRTIRANLVDEQRRRAANTS